MKLLTKFHGELEINEEKVIHFNAGIPGFVEEKEFCILPIEQTPLFVLQSVKSSETAFILTDPFSFFTDYEFNLPEEVTEALSISSDKDVAVFAILTVQEPFEKTTANLQAPVIINQIEKQGKQVILNGTSYTTKHLLITKEGK
ncbi:flagellar assembly protein FliW [Bacillus sp. AG4(2022)]|uniref:flagellar assembly protein FliW n=1 Tax=Bacillus sp. AG4(2022) TaxID=2962594 RepID=UPI002881F70D|nr:flagellar assembly protein FliW [Bacillus sp. AG4(2022)]MDT0162154.1 flagellar assembly protein FliW [Bacillus sp. AG4(2022)]